MSPATSAGGRGGGQGVPSQIAWWDRDAERAVLGALLLYGDSRKVLKLQAKGLHPKSFYTDPHRHVFAAAVSLAKKDEGLDPLLVYGEMETQRTADEGTKALLDVLMGCVPMKGNINAYVERVKEKAAWRKRYAFGSELMEAAAQQNDGAWKDLVARLPRPEPEKPNNVFYICVPFFHSPDTAQS